MKLGNKTLEDIQDISLNIYGRYDLDKSLLWFVEEVGEVVAAVRKGKGKDEVVGELGDVLAWVLCLSNILDINIREALEGTMDKEINRQLKTYGYLKYSHKDIGAAEGIKLRA